MLNKTRHLNIRASLALRDALFLVNLGQGQLELRWHPVTHYFGSFSSKARRTLLRPRKSQPIGRPFSSVTNKTNMFTTTLLVTYKTYKTYMTVSTSWSGMLLVTVYFQKYEVLISVPNTR